MVEMLDITLILRSLNLDLIFQGRVLNEQVPVCWVHSSSTTSMTQWGCPWGGPAGSGRGRIACGPHPILVRCFFLLLINHSPSWSLSGSLSEVSKISCSRRLTMQRAVPAPAARPGGGLGFSLFRWPPARQSKARGCGEGPLGLLSPSQLLLAKIL